MTFSATALAVAVLLAAVCTPNGLLVSGNDPGPPQPRIPYCMNCSYDTYINRTGDFIDASCPQNAPYRYETFHCDRYQCSNGHYYQHVQDGTGGCQADHYGDACPLDSCIKP